MSAKQKTIHKLSAIISADVDGIAIRWQNQTFISRSLKG